jgi:hypothetical protein
LWSSEGGGGEEERWLQAHFSSPLSWFARESLPGGREGGVVRFWPLANSLAAAGGGVVGTRLLFNEKLRLRGRPRPRPAGVAGVGVGGVVVGAGVGVAGVAGFPNLMVRFAGAGVGAGVGAEGAGVGAEGVGVAAKGVEAGGGVGEGVKMEEVVVVVVVVWGVVGLGPKMLVRKVWAGSSWEGVVVDSSEPSVSSFFSNENSDSPVGGEGGGELNVVGGDVIGVE